MLIEKYCLRVASTSDWNVFGRNVWTELEGLSANTNSSFGFELVVWLILGSSCGSGSRAEETINKKEREGKEEGEHTK